jgi:hypothetical protein
MEIAILTRLLFDCCLITARKKAQIIAAVENSIFKQSISGSLPAPAI